jgi:hypothetical protein
MLEIQSEFRRVGLLLTVATAVVAGGSVVARAQTINKCQAAKTKCVIQAVKGLLGCHAAAEGKGIPVDPACLQKQRQKFDGNQLMPPDPTRGCIQKLQAKGGCLTPDETAVMVASIDAFVLDVVTDLDPGLSPGRNTCAAGKKRCVSATLAALMGCHVKAQQKGILDPVCVEKANARFDGGGDPTRGCFAKLEAKQKADRPLSVCPTLDDAAAIAAKRDTWVDAVICQLDPAGGTCRPCGNGAIDATETCDESASPSGCADGEVCESCAVCATLTDLCGNGLIDPAETCDASVSPTGCAEGETCDFCLLCLALSLAPGTP